MQAALVTIASALMYVMPSAVIRFHAFVEASALEAWRGLRSHFSPVSLTTPKGVTVPGPDGCCLQLFVELALAHVPPHLPTFAMPAETCTREGGDSPPPQDPHTYDHGNQVFFRLPGKC